MGPEPPVERGARRWRCRRRQDRSVAGSSGGTTRTAGWFVVARIQPDGTLDDSFSGDGRVFSPTTTRPDRGPRRGRRPAGRIVAAGYTGGHMAVLALTGNGTPGHHVRRAGDGHGTANPRAPFPRRAADVPSHGVCSPTARSSSAGQSARQVRLRR
ncbi:hypothetical protein QA942_38625 [Streptomyces sp. B21-106]